MRYSRRKHKKGGVHLWATPICILAGWLGCQSSVDNSEKILYDL